MKDKVEAKEVLVCSSGVMEQNIDIVIGWRFETRGMSWTTEEVRIFSDQRSCRVMGSGRLTNGPASV